MPKIRWQILHPPLLLTPNLPSSVFDKVKKKKKQAKKKKSISLFIFCFFRFQIWNKNICKVRTLLVRDMVPAWFISVWNIVFVIHTAGLRYWYFPVSKPSRLGEEVSARHSLYRSNSSWKASPPPARVPPSVWPLWFALFFVACKIYLLILDFAAGAIRFFLDWCPFRLC